MVGEQLSPEAILQLWRDRLAKNLRAFRRVKGRNPSPGIVDAVKRSIERASQEGVRPPYQH